MSSTALTHPTTGEVLDLAEAQPEALADAVVQSEQLRGELADLESVISAELVRRLDRSASWTMRVGDPAGARQFEIKAPSPDAGTTGYDAELLLQELRALVERGTIDASAAGRALERTVTITLRLPIGADPRKVEETAWRLVDMGGEIVDPTKVDRAHKPVAGQIAKLRKVPGTGSALDRAMVKFDPPSRKAKVTVKTRGDA